MKEQNNNEKKNELGKNIKRLRKQHNMSQEELAQKLFISRTAISKWESGATEANIEFLMKMATLFNVDLDQLITQNNIKKDVAILPKKEEIIAFQFSKTHYSGFPKNPINRKDELIKKLGYVFGAILFAAGFYLTIIVLAIWGNVPDTHNIYIGQIIAGIPLMLCGIILFVYTLKNDLYFDLLKRGRLINSSVEIKGSKISVSSKVDVKVFNRKNITGVSSYYEKLPRKL